LKYRLALDRELKKRLIDKQIKWFTPNGKQEEFIKMVGNKDVFIGVFSAGNGVGKTALMANVLGHLVYTQQYTENPWFDFPLFTDFSFPKRGRIASSKKNVEEVGAIQTEIKRWWPRNTYATSKMGKNYDSQYIIGDWVVDIMTYEQDVEQYESATLGVVMFDEPPPLSILNASIARMRSGGMIMIFMTPLDTGGEILEDLQERDSIKIGDKELGKVGIIYADIEDNCRIHGVRGHLLHNDIVQMISFYTPEEREARAKGKPSHMVGRIYSDYEDKEPHLIEDDFEIKSEWIHGCIIDPHDAIPFAITWAAIDFEGNVYIYDEFPYSDIDKMKSTNLNFPKYASIIRGHEGRQRIFFRIIDPYFGNKTYGNTGLSPKEELAELGLEFDDGDTSGIEVGHGRVREHLIYDKTQQVNAINHPKLHIKKKCRNHRRAMLRYKRKVDKSGEVKDKVVIEQTYKHFADTIRHLIMKKDEIVDDWRIEQEQDNALTNDMMSGGRGGW